MIHHGGTEHVTYFCKSIHSDAIPLSMDDSIIRYNGLSYVYYVIVASIMSSLTKDKSYLLVINWFCHLIVCLELDKDEFRLKIC